MTSRIRCSAVAAAVLLGMSASGARAQTVQELQQQIDELKAQIKALTAAQASVSPAAPVAAPEVTAPTPSPPDQTAAAAPTPPTPPAAVAADVADRPWYNRLRLRGYTQVRYNAIVAGDDAPQADGSRLRSVHDTSINDDGGFLLRRVRLVLQGPVTDNVEIYLQQDFGVAVNNQSGAERRENFGQLRDAYVDLFDPSRRFRLRLGQSKVPFGWENLQSSSNRVPLDRSDAINSGVPGERDVGIVGYYTPRRVQAVWNRLAGDGQKLFGNYGAFGLGVFNGQGTNRAERNDSRAVVAMATWPFELDGLGGAFRGQVLEVGGSAMLNRYRPELRSGGVSGGDYDDNRVALHAILYPQPFGVQAEWTFGRAPEFNAVSRGIANDTLAGGYVQLMYNLGETPAGRIVPYGRWQRYRGGWKASTNAPRLESDEIEIGVEWEFVDSLELTLAYARMKRREADERRQGRAEGDLIRAQLQFSY